MIKQTEHDIENWLNKEHPQGVYQCDYCGRLHKMPYGHGDFVLLVGGVLDGLSFPELKELQPIDEEGRPNVLVVCKRVGCLVRFGISLLHLK